jgi:tetratricopeptide (TPR) repeat protein
MKKTLLQLITSIGIIVFCCQCQNKEQYAETILSALAEKDQTYQDISSDTLIFQLFNDFKKSGNKEKTALSAFYSGRVYQSQKNYENALKNYMEAQTYAEQINNQELIGSIYFFVGQIYYEQMLFQEAKQKFIHAQELLYFYSNNYNRGIVIYNAIGNCHFIKEELDSTIFYYNKALDLAIFHNDLNQQSILKGNLSHVFREQKDFNNAKKQLKEAILLNNDKPATLYLNLAKVFYEENKYDSVIYYTRIASELAQKENNNSIQSNLNLLLSKMEAKRGNYKQALEYHNQYTAFLSFVLEEKKREDLLIIENKYNYEQTLNNNNQLLIERQRIYLVLLLLLIAIIMTSFFFYRKITAQKTRILKMENTCLEAEQQIQALKNMAESYNEKEKSLRNEVLAHFKILRKVALLKDDKQFSDKSNYKSTPLEKINNIIYGNKKGLDWDHFFESMNALHTDIIGKINQTYLTLDQWERKICYLTCINFNNPEMSTLLDLALNTVEQKKTNIRKKLNIPDRGNIKEFIIQDLDLS